MKGYQTHETFWADFKMYTNMVIRACMVGVFLQIIFVTLAVYQMSDAFEIYITGTNIKMPPSVAFKYLTGFGGLVRDNMVPVEAKLQPYVKNYIRIPLSIYREEVDWLTNNAYEKLHDSLVIRLNYSFLVYVVTILYLLIFIRTSRNLEEIKFMRGGKITPIGVLNKALVQESQKNPLSYLKIGEMTLPFEMESKHILVLGASGSGKGVLLNQLAAQINQRKFQNQTMDRCIFYDLKGEFVAKQYNEELDLIFCPFDSRSLGWNIFNELEILPDYDVISKSLFLATDNKDEYWVRP